VTTFQDKLDALPEMPKGTTHNLNDELAVVTFSGGDMGQMEDALRARLALARELLAGIRQYPTGAQWINDGTSAFLAKLDSEL
jgi:hypothetical protein